MEADRGVPSTDPLIPGASAGSSACDPGVSDIFAVAKMFDTALNRPPLRRLVGS